MGLTVLIGGARSGKSTLAVRRARASGGPVVFIATGEAGDAEMAARIVRHRRERDPAWTTVEEPLELARALEAAPGEAFVIVDCLSFWIANLLDRGDSDSAIHGAVAEAAAVAAAREAVTVAVTNEVGMGVVPAFAAGRRYRDLLGQANAIWVELADEAVLVVAGRMLALEAAGGG